MACTRGSGSGTRWAAAVRSAAISHSDSPWRAAMCSTICCWRMLTSVRCFSSSSMSGEESLPVGDTTKCIKRENKTKTSTSNSEKKTKGAGGKKRKQKKISLVGDPSQSAPHSPPV